MKKQSAYYAHCLHLYGTPQERRDVLTLEALGFNVINPNNPSVDAVCDALRRDYADSPTAQYTDAGAAVMNEVFKPLVRSCDVFAFRGLPDGRIPAGVYKELQWAREFSKTVIELPGNVLGREMTVDETRAYLSEVGQR